jgi:dihydroxyacetone kinase
MRLHDNDKLDLIKEMLEDEDVSLVTLSSLGAADLIELQAVADKITEQIAVVLVARQRLVETNNEQNTSV